MMIELTQIVTKKCKADAYLTLPIDQRVRSRLRVKLDDGRDAAIFLPHGSFLRGGDQLINDTGIIVEILAATETVSTVHCSSPLLLARAAYHLGNRHIPLQIKSGLLRFQHDHVLDAMMQQMGFEVVVEQAPFEPEAGAYQQTPHSHGGPHINNRNHESGHQHNHK